MLYQSAMLLCGHCQWGAVKYSQTPASLNMRRSSHVDGESIRTLLIRCRCVGSTIIKTSAVHLQEFSVVIMSQRLLSLTCRRGFGRRKAVIQLLASAGRVWVSASSHRSILLAKYYWKSCTNITQLKIPGHWSYYMLAIRDVNTFDYLVCSLRVEYVRSSHRTCWICEILTSDVRNNVISARVIMSVDYRSWINELNKIVKIFAVRNTYIRSAVDFSPSQVGRFAHQFLLALLLRCRSYNYFLCALSLYSKARVVPGFNAFSRWTVGLKQPCKHTDILVDYVLVYQTLHFQISKFRIAVDAFRWQRLAVGSLDLIEISDQLLEGCNLSLC